MKTIIKCDQRSPEWRLARAGRLTGSRAGDAIASALKSGGEPAKRRDYRLQLVAERLTGLPQDSDYENDAMRWGTEHEAEALAAYEAITGRLAMPVGFVQRDGLMAGCSPDGVVENFVGLVSIKCPKTATMLAYLRADVVPTDYLPQILCELWVTGAQWCDFFSYDPRLPEHLRHFLTRYTRSEADIQAFEAKALAFLEEVAREESALRGWSVMKEKANAI